MMQAVTTPSTTPQKILPNEEWKVVPPHLLGLLIYCESDRVVHVSSFGRLRRWFKEGWRYSELYGNKQKKFHLLYCMFRIGKPTMEEIPRPTPVVIPIRTEVSVPIRSEVSIVKVKKNTWRRCKLCKNKAMKRKQFCYDCVKHDVVLT